MRLIDADALMQSLGITDMDCDKCAWGDREWRNCKRGGDFEDACCAIENAPTIAEPEIIRCKDCKHYAGEGMYCTYDIIVQFDHFYCYYAERREDEIN